LNSKRAANADLIRTERTSVVAYRHC